MTISGVILDDMVAGLSGGGLSGAGLSAVDPVFAFVSGALVGICAAILIMRWPPRWQKQSDPLAPLFTRDTFDQQLARVSSPEVRNMRKDQTVAAIRARICAKTSENGPKQGPHHAQRFDHGAVLDHIAKVMRAGHENGHRSANANERDTKGAWKEVMSLPPPAKKMILTQQLPEFGRL